MIDQKKIILMSKIAVEKKKFTRKDKEVTDYYLEDYVYVNNFKTRLIVLILIAGLIGGGMMIKVQNGFNIPTTIKEWIYQYIIPYGCVVIGALIVYTFISTLVYTKVYQKAEKRRKSYERAIVELEKYQE